MAKKVHIVQRDQTIREKSIQLRTDDPSTPEEGQVWYNSTQELIKMYIGGNTKSFAFTGETAGQVLYSTTVSTVEELKAAVDSGIVKTVYLRSGTYNLTTLAAPGIVINNDISLYGEAIAGQNAVNIITDPTHYITVSPSVVSVISANTISVTAGSKIVNLNTGTWAVDLTGYNIIIDGFAYKVATNPTSTQLTLERNFSGATNASQSYYAFAGINGVRFQDILFTATGGNHSSLSFNSVVKPVIFSCEFTFQSDTYYAAVTQQNCYGSKIINNNFYNARVVLTGRNTAPEIHGNTFRSTNQLGSNALLSISTGVSTFKTLASINGNIFSGPGSAISLSESSQNVIVSNIINSASSIAISVNANSSNNNLNSNSISTLAGSSTAMQIQGDANTVSSNRIVKATGFAIDFTASAENNYAIGNLITGGATINNTIAANNNRIEDDLSRLGSAPTGTNKDLIDQINSILVTLQNVPQELISQSASVQSGIIDETPVYWDTVANTYKPYDIFTVPSNYKFAGIVKKTGVTSGDVHTIGLMEFTNSGHPYNGAIFDTGNIGSDIYAYRSGLVTSSQLVSSGILSNVFRVGTLLDVQGSGQASYLLLNPSDNIPLGTYYTDFYYGKLANNPFQLKAGISGTAALKYVNDKFYVVTSSNHSGELRAVLTRNVMKNSVESYGSGLVSFGATNASTGEHFSVINEYKRDYNAVSLGWNTPYSGFIHIADVLNSGTVVVNSNFVPQLPANAVILSSAYLSGSTLLTETISSARQHGSSSFIRTTSYTPEDNLYKEIGSVFYIHPNSGTVDGMVEFSTTASVALTDTFPHQIIAAKIQINGQDVAGSERKTSMNYVSGETSYGNIGFTMPVSLYSSSGVINKISALIRYEKGGSTQPATFNGTSILFRGQ